MSVVAATKTPVQKLKKTSAVLLLVGVLALVAGVISVLVYAMTPVTFSQTPGMQVASLVGVLGVYGGVLTLIASLVVRIVAAIKAN